MDVEALRKEYLTAQASASTTFKRYHRLVTELIPSKEFEIRKSELTLKELEAIPSDAKMYRTIGKATFLRDDQGAIKERLQALIKNGQALHKALLEKKTGLEAELSAAEQRQDELREKLEKIGI